MKNNFYDIFRQNKDNETDIKNYFKNINKIESDEQFFIEYFILFHERNIELYEKYKLQNIRKQKLEKIMKKLNEKNN